MTISKEIAPQLPYLRRFARALSGSQTSGDAYVVATLEALIEDPASFPRNMPARSALYHIFLKLWSSMSAKLEPGGAPQTDPRGPADGSPDGNGQWERVRRGGSFLCDDGYCRRYVPTARDKNPPDSSANHTGFRCVKTPP